MATKTREREFNAMRGEFMSIMGSVNKDAEAEAHRRDISEELEHAYSELDRLHEKLQKERSRRKEAEEELQDLRRSKTEGGDVAATEIARKEADLATAKSDRAQMKEWLDRGVAECKRVAEEAMLLRQNLSDAQKTSEELAYEKGALTAHLARVTEDAEALRVEVAELDAQRKAFADHGVRIADELEVSRAALRSTQEAADRVKNECGDLRARVARLDECDKCLGDLCDGVASLIENVGTLETDIASGKFGEKRSIAGAVLSDRGSVARARSGSVNNRSSPQHPYSSGGGGAGDMSGLVGGSNAIRENLSVARTWLSMKRLTPPPQPHDADGSFAHGDRDVVVLDADRGPLDGPSISDTRRLLHALHDSVASLGQSVSRFITERQRMFAEVQRIHTDELAALQRDKAALLARHENEKDELRNRCRELERQIVDVSLRVEAAGAAGGGGVAGSEFSFAGADGMLDGDAPPEMAEEDRKALFDRLERAFSLHQELQQDLETLKNENHRWRQKASNRKIDWAKVNESRLRYEQLLKEIEMMEDYKHRLANENEHLGEILRMHQQKAAETPMEAAARKYKQQAATRLNQAAFDEWKKSQIAKVDTTT